MTAELRMVTQAVPEPKPDDSPPPGVSMPARLEWGAARLGGKRALAAATEISEAQLYRYMEGQVAIPHDKLISLAAAFGADSAWLLTGRGPWQAPMNRERPEFQGQLLQEIQEGLELLLVEYQRVFSPQLKSRMVRYLYDVLRHDEAQHQNKTVLDRFKLLQYISFLGEFRTPTELDVLSEAFEILEYRGLSTDYTQHHQLLTTWCNLLVRGMRGYYNSYAGQVYFERMGQTLPTEAIAELHNLVNMALQTLQQPTLRWLDLGCGNGRHLAHLHKFVPNLKLRGIELSDLGVDFCQKLENSERLPVGCVTQGDMRLIPYKSATFDVVYARLSLQGLPYLGAARIGLGECLAEVERVTAPGGLFIATCPLGEGFDYKLPFQCLTPLRMNSLLGTGWRLLENSSKDWQTLKNQRQAAGEFTATWQKEA